MASSRSSGLSDSPPDIMNDPAYATNSGGEGNQGASEPDTCRICRGEGSATEPLFYPCKCSGSIKFVHQECLMEWLLHSQKKHCELCKTPFRFTKLYDPQMPPSVPFPVFIRHLLSHSLRTMLIWLRFLLVCFVWVGWLPWSMRVVWRFLFWLGDGGWYIWDGPAAPDHQRMADAVAASTQVLADALSTVLVTSPANGNLFASSSTTSRITEAAATALPSILTPVSQTLNMSAGSPVSFTLFSLLFSGNAQSNVKLMYSHPTFLSNVTFLNTLTRSPTINKLIIDTFEGQIITVCVVIAFILVFLIREWVVQQQPGINMGEFLDADFWAPARPDMQDGIIPEGEALGNARAAVHQRGREQQAEQPRRDLDLIRGANGNAGPGRPIARARRRINFPPRTEEARVDTAPDLVDNPENESQQNANPFGRRLEDGEVFKFYSGPHVGDSSTQQRPGMPTRDTLSKAAEIRRTIEEEPAGGAEWPGLQEFKTLWRRGDAKPAEVLRIIEEENRTVELGWIVDAMKRLQRSDSSGGPVGSPQGPSNELKLVDTLKNEGNMSWLEALQSSPGGFSPNGFPSGGIESTQKGKGKAQDPNAVGGLQDFGSNESWLDVLTASSLENRDTGVEIKGKGKARNYEDFRSEKNANSGSSFPSDWLHEGSKENRLIDKDENSALKYEGLSNTSSNYLSAFDANESTFRHRPGPSSSQKEITDTYHDDRGLGKLRINPLLEQVSQDWDGSSLEVHASSLGEGSTVHDDRSDVSSEFDESPADLPSNHDYTETSDIPETAVEETPNESRRDVQPSDNEPNVQAVQEPFRPPPQGLFERLTDWLWGDIVHARPAAEDIQGNDERVVDDLAAEAPFVPVHRHGPAEQQAPPAEEDPDLPNAGDVALDPVDVEAMEDGEDFEGVMELIGMRGPLGGLFQNGMFSAVLISTTVGTGIWFPYIWGKVVLVFLCHPMTLLVKVPLRGVSFTADLVVDSVFFSAGSFIYWIDTFLRLCLTPLGFAFPVITRYTRSSVVSSAAKAVAEGAIERISKMVLTASERFSVADYPAFSILSHEALHLTETRLSHAFQYIFWTLNAAYRWALCDAWETTRADVINGMLSFSPAGKLARLADFSVANLQKNLQATWKQGLFNISLDIPGRTTPIDLSLSYWSPWDRAIAIIVGYAFFAFVGALYLKRGSPFSTSRQGRKIELVITKILQQSGGVLKVILIIGIEMIVFPLYCGMLLDLALLPLFEQATFMSRIQFTLNAPFTSIFVHWFVGTCYMFHFALFVSMCRKIMRSGVLYFIRDPDDATFHPVRDVLERSVSTQLRKIAFSALVYGALVIVCLGGVVWGLFYVFDGILPIHWSSNEPVLEFPVDLLFYNFLMPLVVRIFKPSDGLHAMYSWWFRVCGRMLRLTWFLFGDRREDEEGRHIRRTWGDILIGKKGDVHKPVIGDDRKTLAEDRNVDAYFLRDGKYVRAPASDQVRIPKGGKVFLEVNEDNDRIDGEPDREDGLHGRNSELFTKVYVPPWFRVRIALFILFIWIFAAVTGVGITIVPLVFGRMIFSMIIPNHLRMNDVYAFSIGIYILGGFLYGIVRFENALTALKRALLPDTESPIPVVGRTLGFIARIARLVYTYGAFTILLPSLFALLMEFYVIIPLHTYFAADEKHIIHFIQDWTLGVLYVKMTARFILWYPRSRPAVALHAIIQRGWLDPDVRVATRCFIFPATVVMAAALLVPLPLGYLVNELFFAGANVVVRSQVYRYSYPAVLAMGIGTCLLYLMGVMLKGWRQKIRDEVYLIGERLHNFGERRAPPTSSIVVM